MPNWGKTRARMKQRRAEKRKLRALKWEGSFWTFWPVWTTRQFSLFKTCFRLRLWRVITLDFWCFLAHFSSDLLLVWDNAERRAVCLDFDSYDSKVTLCSDKLLSDLHTVQTQQQSSVFELQTLSLALKTQYVTWKAGSSEHFWEASQFYSTVENWMNLWRKTRQMLLRPDSAGE